MQTIAVIFGGRSAEHDVSVITAVANVIKPLELTKRYQVEAVYVNKSGAWYWDDKLKDIQLYTSGAIQEFMHRSQPAAVQFDGGMKLVKSSGLAGRKLQRKIDIVFPAMHGTYGEDGSLMGLLDMANVPYVGCGLSASAVAMDKVLAKQVVSTQGLPTAKFMSFATNFIEREPAAAVKAVQKELTYPLFVKPAHLGSSIGISRVSNETELRNGLEVAAHYDDKILVEEAVPNLIEVTVPILGNDQNLRAAMVEKPLTKAEDFFDFDTKYMQGGKKGGKAGGSKGSQGYSEIPAQLPGKLYDQAEDTAKQVYQAIGCSGIARVDLLIDSKASKIYFNEVNPLPGGLYAHNWQAAGVSNIDLVNTLIQLGVERWNQRQQVTTSFSTNYLKQF